MLVEWYGFKPYLLSNAIEISDEAFFLVLIYLINSH